VCSPEGFDVAFSASQLLASFVLDALIKSTLIGFVGMAITSTSPFPFIWPAVGLSIFHFICIFLGCTAAVAFELVGIRFRPTPKFWLGLLFANLLFGATLNTLMALQHSRSPFLELSPVTIVLVATNLIPIFLVAICRRIVQRIKRLNASRVTAS
jgi:hypothetical protein